MQTITKPADANQTGINKPQAQVDYNNYLLSCPSRPRHILEFLTPVVNEILNKQNHKKERLL